MKAKTQLGAYNSFAREEEIPQNHEIAVRQRESRDGMAKAT